MTEESRPRRPRRVPIWQAVRDAGLAESETRARALVLTGQVLVDGRPVDKPGTPVSVTANIRIRGLRTYASRGGDKLEAALRHFQLAVAGRVALDAGASTGGFTDCLLQHGAARVYAVEVGYGQLLGRLRQDPRVVNMERTNLSEVAAVDLKPCPSVVTLDLSYLALADAWKVIRPWLPKGADIVCLVKPLFEVADAEARRTGRITGEQPYIDLLRRLVHTAGMLEWSVCGIMASPIRGHHGTLEFLMHIRSEGGATEAYDVPGLVRQALTPEAAVPDLPSTHRHLDG